MELDNRGKQKVEYMQGENIYIEMRLENSWKISGVYTRREDDTCSTSSMTIWGDQQEKSKFLCLLQPYYPLFVHAVKGKACKLCT